LKSLAQWSAEQYLKFADERTRAARDLLQQVPLSEPKLIYDLGCGPGNSTELLVAAYPGARITGVDKSAEMLVKARKVLPEIEFVQGDLQTWHAPPEADLLYSNATFQWVDDHITVLQRLIRGLREGAVLAVQMPDNLAEPSHVAMTNAASGADYAGKLAGASRQPLPPVSAYYNALKPSCRSLDIWHTVYNHPLAGAAAIVEWVKGTGLRPFLAPLSATEQDDYLSRYQSLISQAYPLQSDGKVLLRFPRLFIVAVR
jgi:trans-aconitate 2-methyltransferase